MCNRWRGPADRGKVLGRVVCEDCAYEFRRHFPESDDSRADYSIADWKGEREKAAVLRIDAAIAAAALERDAAAADDCQPC